jgi:hypothetical protein
MLLYLDLNHWIGLSQARVGHPPGRTVSRPICGASASDNGGNSCNAAVGDTLFGDP